MTGPRIATAVGTCFERPRSVGGVRQQCPDCSRCVLAGGWAMRLHAGWDEVGMARPEPICRQMAIHGGRSWHNETGETPGLCSLRSPKH
jgi:hypothetical protein